MNRRLSCILCAVCCYFLMSANVLAQYSDETPIISKTGQVGLFYTQSAKTLGRGRLVVGIYSDFSSDKNFLKSVRNVSDSIVSPYMDIENFYPHIAFGLFRSLDFSVFMPIYLDRLEESSLGTSKVGGLQAGYGDLEMQLKFQYPPYEHPRLFDMAYSGAISLPTGMEKDAFFPPA